MKNSGVVRGDNDKIELRSEKVRKLIDKNPPFLVRWGTVIVIVIFLAFILVICFMPYPYSKGETILQHIRY